MIIKAFKLLLFNIYLQYILYMLNLHYFQLI